MEALPHKPRNKQKEGDNYKHKNLHNEESFGGFRHYLGEKTNQNSNL